MFPIPSSFIVYIYIHLPPPHPPLISNSCGSLSSSKGVCSASSGERYKHFQSAWATVQLPATVVRQRTCLGIYLQFLSFSLHFLFRFFYFLPVVSQEGLTSIWKNANRGQCYRKTDKSGRYSCSPLKETASASSCRTVGQSEVSGTASKSFSSFKKREKKKKGNIQI